MRRTQQTASLLIGLVLPVWLASCEGLKTSEQGNPGAPRSGVLIAANRLQIRLTLDPQRPYEVGFLGKKYTEQEILAYLEAYFTSPTANSRDVILLLPDGKGIYPAGDLVTPITEFAIQRNLLGVSYPTNTNAIDSLLYQSDPAEHLGAPVRD